MLRISSFSRHCICAVGFFVVATVSGGLFYLNFIASSRTLATQTAGPAGGLFSGREIYAKLDGGRLANRPDAGFAQATASPAAPATNELTTVLADVQRRAYFLYQSSEHSAATIADNPDQGLIATLGAAAYTVAASADRAKASRAWQLGLKLRGIGRGDKLEFLPEDTSTGTTCQENKAAYTHGAAFAVDYENSPAGLRQNYTLFQRPAGRSGPVQVQLALHTNLQVAAHADGQALSLREAGKEVLRYAGLRAWDATGRVLASRMQLSADEKTVALVVDDAHATYPLIIDPLISTPITIAEPGPKKRTTFGHRIAGAGDVNGDGYDDVLIAASDTFNKSSVVYRSRVYLYHGSKNGLVTADPTVLVAPANTRAFGQNMAGAGDIDNDGYDDILISAESISSGPRRVYFYRGSSTGLIIEDPTLLASPGSNSGDYFGNSVAGVGDIDGDSYNDVMVGAFGNNNYQGRAYLYRGTSTGLNIDPVIIANPANTGEDWFGVSVAGAGDVNKDGYADVVIGAQGALNNRGRAYVYHGSDAGLVTPPTILNEPHGVRLSQFGVSVCGVGDVNGDGYSDILVGIIAGLGGTPNRAYFYNGGPDGINTTHITLDDPMAKPGSFFGLDIASAGDVDKDGYADVLIGAYGSEGNKGRAYLYHGSSSGLHTTSSITLKTPESTTTAFLFGSVVAGVGDIDGDGDDDIMIGDPYANRNQGQVYLYQGSSIAPLPVELVSFTAVASGPSAVSLTWATASEKENASFTVERSTGGQIFAAIAKLNGAGTSTTSHRYTFRDEHLPPEAAALYYRLRQTDFDGTVSYSPVRAVKRPQTEVAFHVYPTVAIAGKVRYSYNGPASTATLEVLNQSGQVVRYHALSSTEEGDLSLAGLPGGVYTVRYSADGKLYYRRCVVE
ncbi:FG-GAP repeat protein [Hymenobacter sp. BT188]|uniref:FG-GAP-like repeat-containing protein n=1 Tax=Hymenobacter sp. BT188 TaxID=2763504 RepID=UPI001650DE2C|nr:FG-GAP-like repeat-containing protein [Hymenobacter sp. BT188]MBC6608080.1 FG-GAP repeat protein [Hymenobacter sp. BT188]